MRRIYRPWLSYLLLGAFFAVQVPFRLAESELLRAGLLLVAAAVFLGAGVRATLRRPAGGHLGADPDDTGPAARSPASGHDVADGRRH